MLRLKLSARAMRTLGGKALCMGFAEGHAGRLLVDLAQNQPGGLPPNSSSVDLQGLRTHSHPQIRVSTTEIHEEPLTLTGES